MERTFAETSVFSKKWSEMGLTDDDLQELQARLLKNPDIGDIIQGTGGARKVRFALSGRNKGKSGGARIIYVDVVFIEQTHLLFCYPKGSQDNLTDSQKKQLKAYIKTLKGE